MRTVVADSTVLIYLAKLGDLDLLCDLFESVLVPEAVYDEVVNRGHEAGYPDALTVEEATDECLENVGRTDEVGQLAEQLQNTANLGDGEAAAIAVAQRRDVRCLTDDHAARTTAESLGVDVGGTIFVLLEARTTGRLTEDAYVARIDDLSDSGFRMSASLYRRAIEAGRNPGPDANR
ncbi:MAG: hypothetical protein ABEH77_09710 [Halobacteriaceae archaeon]